jgi:aryl-alcohol dehydrogenase-like predicted oxidoreductase
MLDVLLIGLLHGVTVIDTAVNYRRGRSERVAGRAVRQAIANRLTSREQVVIITKGGYARPRGGIDSSARAPEPHDSRDHCFQPACLRHQIDISLETLDLERIDIYCLHNPEEQRARHSAKDFDSLMRCAFATLEAAVDNGSIASYGVSTWHAAAAPEDRAFLARLKALAAQAAGGADHLAAVQAPLSMLRRDALAPSHEFDGALHSLPEVCSQLGVELVASASAGGGRMPALAALSARWTASIPGVTTALLGTLDPRHLLGALNRT